MVSTIIFLVILLAPFILFIANAVIRRADQIGIAGGIKKPRGMKAAKTPKPAKVKRTTMRARRVSYCGKGLSHFALAIVGSQDACRFCGRLESVPPEDGDTGADEEKDAAVAEVEHMLDGGQH
jgi:hypothetical protein